MKQFIKRVSMIIISIIFPARCVSCGKIIDGKYGFCAVCEPVIPRVEGSKDEFSFGHGRLRYVDICAAPFYYEGGIRNALTRMKFRGKCAYTTAFSSPMVAALDRGLECGYYPRPDIITWVPISAKRKKKRGYDQSRLLALHLSREMGLPLIPTLAKVVDNPPQSELDATARKGNVIGVYELLQDTCISLEDRAIILVDDIFTTGATIDEAAKILRGAGVERVYALFAAKTRYDKNKHENS